MIEQNNLFYGDITEPDVITQTINSVMSRFPNGLDLITADGGFDVKVFVAQEILSSKLLLCEIYLALQTQKINGMFIEDKADGYVEFEDKKGNMF